MAHPDLNTLINVLIPVAQKLLSKNGEFYPFGASMDKAGKVTLCHADPTLEGSSSQVIVETLTEGLRQSASKGEIKAAGICFDSKMKRAGEPHERDAICMHLEHREQAPIRVYLPYARSLLGKYKYGELSATSTDPKIFGRLGAS